MASLGEALPWSLQGTYTAYFCVHSLASLLYLEEKADGETTPLKMIVLAVWNREQEGTCCLSGIWDRWTSETKATLEKQHFRHDVTYQLDDSCCSSVTECGGTCGNANLIFSLPYPSV